MMAYLNKFRCILFCQCFNPFYHGSKIKIHSRSREFLLKYVFVWLPAFVILLGASCVAHLYFCYCSSRATSFINYQIDTNYLLITERNKYKFYRGKANPQEKSILPLPFFRLLLQWY